MSYPVETYLTLDVETLAQRLRNVELLLRGANFWLAHYERCLESREYLEAQRNHAKEKVRDYLQDGINIEMARMVKQNVK